MRRRCRNPAAKDYHNYGGRGITVCARWQASYVAFLADVGRRPSPQHTLDRINNAGDYEPGNVRWATPKEQHANTRPRPKHRRQAPYWMRDTWARRKGREPRYVWVVPRQPPVDQAAHEQKGG
jgi:hypothetical protein